MTDREDRGNDAIGRPDQGGDAIERLLRAAGPRPAVPEERAERVRSAVHAHWRRSVRGRKLVRRVAWAAVPLAAAAAWVVLVSPDLSPWIPVERWLRMPAATLVRADGSVLRPDGGGVAVGSELAAGTALETAADGRVALRLGANASVRIDTSTRLRVVSRGELFLDHGAVYVDTGDRSGNRTPVSVRTPLGFVRDIGTQYLVRSGGGAVKVSVREGMARFESGDRSHDAVAGVRLTVREDGGVREEQVPSFGPEWDWVLDVAPPYALEGSLLHDYLAWIEKETGLRVEYRDRSIASDATIVVLHGSIEGLRPDETLGVVLPTCGLRHTIEGATAYIERAPPGS